MIKKIFINFCVAFIICGTIIGGSYMIASMDGSLSSKTGIAFVSLDEVGFSSQESYVEVTVVDKNIESSFWDRSYVVVVKEKNTNNKYVFNMSKNAYYNLEIGTDYNYNVVNKELYSLK